MSDMSSTSGYMGATYFGEFGPRFFDMSSAGGCMGAVYFQEFGPRFFDMSSATGNMGAKYVQEFGPRFSASRRWNLQYLNANCHVLNSDDACSIMRVSQACSNS